MKRVITFIFFFLMKCIEHIGTAMGNVIHEYDVIEFLFNFVIFEFDSHDHELLI